MQILALHLFTFIGFLNVFGSGVGTCVHVYELFLNVLFIYFS